MVLRAPVRNDLMSGYFFSSAAFFSSAFFSAASFLSPAFFFAAAFFCLAFFLEAFFSCASFFSVALTSFAVGSGAGAAGGACAKTDVVKRKTKPMTNNAKRFILNYLLEFFDFDIHLCNPRTIMIFTGQSSINYMISLNNIKFLFLGQCLPHPKDPDKWGIPPHPVGIFSSS